MSEVPPSTLDYAPPPTAWRRRGRVISLIVLIVAVVLTAVIVWPRAAAWSGRVHAERRLMALPRGALLLGTFFTGGQTLAARQGLWPHRPDAIRVAGSQNTGPVVPAFYGKLQAGVGESAADRLVLVELLPIPVGPGEPAAFAIDWKVFAPGGWLDGPRLVRGSRFGPLLLEGSQGAAIDVRAVPPREGQSSSVARLQFDVRPWPPIGADGQPTATPSPVTSQAELSMTLDANDKLRVEPPRPLTP